MILTRRSVLTLIPLAAGCRKEPSPTIFVDPALATLIPSDTDWMVGVRLEQLRKTAAFQDYVVKRRLPIVDEFFRRAGLDLNKDLWEVLLAGSVRGTSALLRGKFSEMGMEPKIMREGATRFGHGGFTLLGDEKYAVAFLNPTTALAGSVAALKHIIDHRNETSGLPSAINSRVARIPSSNQIWFAGSFAGLIPSGPLQRFAEGVQFVSGGLDVRQSLKLQVLAEAASVEQANRLRDGIRGVVGMGRLSTSTEDVETLRFYDSLRADADGNNLKIGLEANLAALDGLLRLVSPLNPSRAKT